MLELAFQQPLEPAGGALGSTLIALVPVAMLLILLAALRLTAWAAVLAAGVVTFLLAVLVWDAPVGNAAQAWFYGSLTGIWAVDWIVFWGVMIFNTMVETGAFERFKNWLLVQATPDVRIQTLLMAWAFGALLEGLVGFGYPWAVVAPILVAIGIRELDAIRVAAIANNAPVSFGALGVPIIGLAKVTGLDLFQLSATVGRIVALLALLPPWILIYLVAGRRGLRDGWPLAIAGSLGYIAGQFPVSQFAGPYLPDVVGSLVCFGVLLGLIRFWKPKTVLGYGGTPIEEQDQVRYAVEQAERERPTGRGALMAVAPFLVLVVVVIAWAGPWSSLPDWTPGDWVVSAQTSIGSGTVDAEFKGQPLIAGTAILVSWILILALLRPRPAQIRSAFRTSFSQMWGALLVGVLIFGLAFEFNFAGMANSMAHGFAQVGDWYIILAPILGWIAVALSGSNTSSNAIFGGFQYTVGKLLHFPVFLAPSLNSVGAETGKPVAPQTASVGVSTTGYTRREGDVIRHNLAWTLIVLAYLIVIGLFYWKVLPGAMR